MTTLVPAAETKPQVSREDYARAERFLPWNARHLHFNTYIEPHWIKESDRFWYRSDGPQRKQFLVVDAERNQCEPAFNHDRLAAALSAATGKVYDQDQLPFDTFEFVDGEAAIRFTIEDTAWTCDLSSYACERQERWKPTKAEATSPDGEWAVSLREHNLHVRSLDTGEERALTIDGEQWYDYGSRPEGRCEEVTDRVLGRILPPVVLWSPDSTKVLTHRLNQRQVEDMHLVQTVFPDSSLRPVAHSFRQALVGDEHTPMVELFIIDITNGRMTAVDFEPETAVVYTPLELQRAWWSEDGEILYFVHEDRDTRALRLVKVDARTGSATVLVEERGESSVMVGPTSFERPNVRVLGNTGEYLWYSMRDGWGHLYLYDGTAREPKRQITRGPWVVHDILRVDQDRRCVYLTAGGRETERDPYFRHLYRVGLDDSDVILLTPEDADHAVTFSPSGKYFVDTYSRIDLPGVSVLRSADGRLIRPLEEADVSQLLAMGWRFPERFRVKARDGVTDIYGAIVWPSNFDPSRSYPVLDSIYPGPSVIKTPKQFAGVSDRAFPRKEWLWDEQALAELGFVTVTIDGQGTPYRSKAFIDVASGKNFGEAGGLADHVAGIRQLGERYPCLDMERIGIFGHSGGGYASTRAILQFPDFYKVAVSSAGNHDQEGYVAMWGERYIGLLGDDNYREQANKDLAANLKGKLLLVYGELDDNVPPALTLQLIDALIQANKDFDLLILPCTSHNFVDLREGVACYEEGLLLRHPYFLRRKWDYFVRHLLGVEPPEGYAISRPCAPQDSRSQVGSGATPTRSTT